jgi:hypothetical protein
VLPLLLHVLQMERWASRSSSAKARVVISLEKAEHLAAAETVVRTVYGDGGALLQLKPQDMVQAVLLADLMALDSSMVVVPGCSILEACPEWEEVLQALVAVPVLPDFLLPVVAAVCRAWARSGREEDAVDFPHRDAMQSLLLKVFGNLEAAWAHEEMRRELLALPPACMLQLLGSTELAVVTENTVLFTVEAYIEVYREQPQVPPAPPQQPGHGHIIDLRHIPQALPSRTQTALRSLVRFQHLTNDSQLRALASGIASYRTEQVRSYMQMALVSKDITPGDIKRFVADRSRRWNLPPRRLLAAAATYGSRAELSWTLPVADIKAACERRALVKLPSPSSTPPRYGQAWCLEVHCSWDTERSVADVGVFCTAHKASLGLVAGRVSVRVQAGARQICSATESLKVSNGKGLGWRCAIIKGMAGGWDEAAWEAKGLPLEGNLQVHLAVEACV